MLILTYADGLGIDFHQLCQRILESAGNGYRGTQIHIEFREFFRCQGRGGVNRGAGFIDDGIADIGEIPEHFHRHGFCLTGGGTVTDGDMIDPVLADQTG